MRSHVGVPILAVVVVSGCATTSTEQIATGLKDPDCIAYQLQRGDRAPGSVIQYRDVAGKRVAYPVCDNLYPANKSAPGRTSLTQAGQSTMLDASVGVGLLASLVTNPETANRDLTAGNVKKVRVAWGPTQIRVLDESASLNEAGKVVPMDGACQAALQELKDTNRLTGVYVVQEAMQVQSLQLSTDVPGEQPSSAGFNLKKALDFKPTVRTTEKDNRTVTVDEPLYVCALPPVLITGFAPAPRLPDGATRISGRPVSASEWRDLNR